MIFPLNYTHSERDFEKMVSNGMVCLLLLVFSILLTISVNSEHQGTSVTPYTITCDPGAEAGCHDKPLEQIAAEKRYS
jgi:hypothetical protein